MNTTLHVKLLSEKLVLKVEQMREQGFNVPTLVRNFLEAFPIDKQKGEVS